MDERKTCVECHKDFLVIGLEKSFLEKHRWPLPVRCPVCRQKRRMALRNPRKLVKDICDKCQKDIIVTFERQPSDAVYCREHYREWMESSDHLQK